jgi:YggT family protein
MNINPFISLIVQILDIYAFLLIAWIILNLLLSFEVVNRHNRFIYIVSDFLFKATEPVLRRIRRYMPNLGPIDLSPIVVFLAISFITNFLYTYFYTH